MIRSWKVTALRVVSGASALLAQLRRGAEVDREAAIPADDVEVLQPLGLRVRPVAPDPARGTLEAFVVEQPNGDRVAVVLVDKATQAGDVQPAAGETLLHGLAERSAVVHIRASGDIELTPKAGRNVILAGGSTPVAKEGSITTGHVHTATFALVAPSGGGAVTGTITITSATDTVATGAGSPHVRVP